MRVSSSFLQTTPVAFGAGAKISGLSPRHNRYVADTLRDRLNALDDQDNLAVDAASKPSGFVMNPLAAGAMAFSHGYPNMSLALYQQAHAQVQAQLAAQEKRAQDRDRFSETRLLDAVADTKNHTPLLRRMAGLNNRAYDRFWNGIERFIKGGRLHDDFELELVSPTNHIDPTYEEDPEGLVESGSVALLDGPAKKPRPGEPTPEASDQNADDDGPSSPFEQERLAGIGQILTKHLNTLRPTDAVGRAVVLPDEETGHVYVLHGPHASILRAVQTALPDLEDHADTYSIALPTMIHSINAAASRMLGLDHVIDWIQPTDESDRAE